MQLKVEVIVGLFILIIQIDNFIENMILKEHMRYIVERNCT